MAITFSSSLAPNRIQQYLAGDFLLERSRISPRVDLTHTDEDTMGLTMDRKVEFNTLIRAQPARVYDAIATAEGLDAWFTKGASVDARTGGHISFRWQDYGLGNYSGENEGPVLEARRPERFVFQWKADSGQYLTTVEISFEPVDAGTIVKLIEYGYEDSPVGTQDFLNRVSGWAQVLTLMKFYVEHGVTY